MSDHFASLPGQLLAAVHRGAAAPAPGRGPCRGVLGGRVLVAVRDAGAAPTARWTRSSRRSRRPAWRWSGLNFFAGDLAGPDCGVLSIPGRSGQFRDNIDVVAGIGERLGVRGFNALYGNRVDGVDPAAQDELAAENIVLAAKAAAGIGATVLIEPVSGPKPYPLRTADDAVAVVQRARAAGAANVGFLCDLYHLASNGDDLDAAIAAHAGVIAHVQIADAPGRGEPGSGQLDLDRYLAALEDRGYRGWVSLEYKPHRRRPRRAWPGCPGSRRRPPAAALAERSNA